MGLKDTPFTPEAAAEQQWDDYLSTLMVGETIPPETVLAFVDTLVMTGKREDCLQAAALLKIFAGHYHS